MNDDRSELYFLFAYIGVALMACVLLVVFIAFGDYAIEKNITCPRFAAAVERPYRYSFWAGGCFVQSKDGQWVSSRNYWNNVLKQ